MHWLSFLKFGIGSAHSASGENTLEAKKGYAPFFEARGAAVNEKMILWDFSFNFRL